MRRPFLLTLAFTTFFLLASAGTAHSQSHAKDKDTPASVDEEKEILKEIREAYKAPFEVHEDVLKELRKLYQEPTPEREAKIFKELRRLYTLSPEQEAALLRQVRRAYEQPSTEREEQLFREIARMDPLPHGTVAPALQANSAEKLFRKLDLNGDGFLGIGELPESLRAERGRWDANGDGVLDQREYWSAYQNKLHNLSEKVANGEIDLKLGNRGPSLALSPTPDERKLPAGRVGRFPSGVPEWFTRLDADSDGQVGLYEWLREKLPVTEFATLDSNKDGYITAEELLRYLAVQK